MKRTKKEFIPYNDYQDRPFGLKWGTSFSMEELTTSIEKNNQFSQKKTKSKPLMSPNEIDDVLIKAYLKNKRVAVYLNARDQLGRFVEPVEGQFKGEYYTDYFVIEERAFMWEDVRYVELIEKIIESKEN
ncbi:hypothetical protein [Vagococcus xieshaowenii]|uniref:YolD-like protein n=1 Tax=Vagococcus xieshaowenii TaxID=2562451 RepID=A0AAJ5EFX1_9ENTE|nr:hypothetical protein [Vagococcus xieshaowenii]QCA28793.1 hypothetical protein E4Z98_05475 [Vagococcus xieshaowenii]TFZ43006.1 hypothetical protein E4031_01170 [Vagococcus xieshaowenii]